MEHTLDCATLFCVGLMVGTELCVSAFINPVVRRLEAAPQAQAARLFAKRLGAAMPFWYVLSLCLIAATAVLHRHQPGDGLLITACAAWVAVIVLTLAVLVPINNRIANSGSAVPIGQLQRDHVRWDTLHRWRILALSGALICVLAGLR